VVASEHAPGHCQFLLGTPIHAFFFHFFSCMSHLSIFGPVLDPTGHTLQFFVPREKWLSERISRPVVRALRTPPPHASSIMDPALLPLSLRMGPSFDPLPVLTSCSPLCASSRIARVCPGTMADCQAAAAPGRRHPLHVSDPLRAIQCA
jgi:hypothetical protein